MQSQPKFQYYFKIKFYMMNLKFTWKVNQVYILKAILDKRRIQEGLNLPNIKTDYKTIVIKTQQNPWKSRQSIKSLKMELGIFRDFLYDESDISNQFIKNDFHKLYWDNWQAK